MEIVVTGLNHRRAPVELRERLALSTETVPAALKRLELPERVLLSTCNRVETYAVAEDPHEAETLILRFLAEAGEMEGNILSRHLYRHRGIEAVRHLFRVASGLDALVVGETQIAGQVKNAYRTAQETGTTGRILNPLFQHAFHTAKRIHTETGIGRRNVSVPSVAVGMAEQIFDRLSDKTVMVLGAGETADLTLRALQERGVRAFLVLNRTLEKAWAMVERFGGEAHPLDELDRFLPRADIVVSCLSVSGFMLDRERVRPALRARRNEPTLLLDLSVPRSIEPPVGKLENVYLFNVDNLESIVNRNLAERARELDRCTPIIDEEAAAFQCTLASTDVAGVVKAMHEHVRRIGGEELEQALTRLKSLDPEAREEMRKMVHRIVSRILHEPTTALREEASGGEGTDILRAVQRLFKIR